MIEALEKAGQLAEIAPFATEIELTAYGFCVSVYLHGAPRHRWIIGYDAFEVDNSVIECSMKKVWEDMLAEIQAEIQEEERQEAILERRNGFYVVEDDD